ncbi:hypothetical protein HU200_043085 [Digitaria exilis]|uniref:F-box domain-containing protein n=1 Tax=Digitaria exilis TaxID=1010633 RepID=A0A835EEB7_9POAL|nr:hypothetical protein HU200_043085 [Digitaria exilis]
MHSHGGSGSKRQRSDEGAEQPDAGSLRIDTETRCRAGKGPAMAPLLPGASSLKKRRVGGVAEEGQAKAAAEEEEEDRISSLPEDLRLRILALLPLTSAIRTGVLSSRWRALWARRWPVPASLDLHHHPIDDPDLLHASLERRGRRRLDRFALTLHFGRHEPEPHRYLGDKDIHRCLEYAAPCNVEDLHVDISDHWVRISSMLSFPSGFSNLVRLSLLRVGSVSFGYSLAFPALEIIHIHSARSVDLDDLLSASPRLRTLDLRYVEFLDDDMGAIYVSPVRRCHLRSLTIAECNRITKIHAGRACGLRSLHLSSDLFPTYKIPSTALLEDLYICLRGHNYNPLKQWIKELPNLTNLKVLTICSNALRVCQLSSHFMYLSLPPSFSLALTGFIPIHLGMVYYSFTKFALQRVYALARFGAATCLTRLRSLPSLRELQLLMFAMASNNFAHIYMFLKTCRCPQLERLFVEVSGKLLHSVHCEFGECFHSISCDHVVCYWLQLPTSSHDTVVGNSSEAVEEDKPAEVSEEDDPDEVLSKEDEPDEELSEEDETDGDLYEEDETDGDLSEEDETEYMLEERPYCEDVYDEDPLDENVPQEEQSEEDVPEYGLNNLMIARMMKFKGQYHEMRLVSFLLRKAPVLKKLLLVAPKGHIKALGKDTVDISYAMESKLLRSRKSSLDAWIILSETDFGANQPVHSVLFPRF